MIADEKCGWWTVKETDLETDGNLTIACESCGHLNLVEVSLSSDLQPLIRCSECCHPQPLCQSDLTPAAEFPDFSTRSGKERAGRHSGLIRSTPMREQNEE